MDKRIFLLCILAAAVIQVTIMDYFRIFAVKPNLLLLGVVVAGISFRLRWVLIISLCAGLLNDIFVINKIGLATILFPFWGFIVVDLSRKISFDNAFIKSLVVFAVVLLNAVITRMIFAYFGSFVPTGIFLRTVILEPLYTGVIAYFVFRYLIRK